MGPYPHAELVLTPKAAAIVPRLARRALADLIEEQQGAPLLVAVAFQSDVHRIRAHLGLSPEELPYLATWA